MGHVVAQLLSRVCLFATPWTASHQASLSFPISWSLLKLMFIESGMPSNPLVLSCPLHFLLSIFLIIRVFSSESVFHIRWPKYWSFSFKINPSNGYFGLISFRIDWFDLFVSKELSRIFSSTTIQKHQFFSTQPFLWYNSQQSCIHDYWKIHSFDCMDLCWHHDVSAL